MAAMDDGVPQGELVVSAAGYGVKRVASLDAVEPLAQRCGATLDAVPVGAHAVTVRATWESSDLAI